MLMVWFDQWRPEKSRAGDELTGSSLQSVGRRISVPTPLADDRRHTGFEVRSGVMIMMRRSLITNPRLSLTLEAAQTVVVAEMIAGVG